MRLHGEIWLPVVLRAVQQAYMQSGGSDPGLLAQMHDLQLEAQRLDQAPLDAQAKARRKSKSFSCTEKGRIGSDFKEALPSYTSYSDVSSLLYLNCYTNRTAVVAVLHTLYTV